MQEHRLDYTNFYWNTGYGYDDPGREKVEQIFASVFHTEDALVRPSIASGTHALYLTLSGILKHGDEVIAISGRPYDTMLTVLGEEGNEPCNLKEMGIVYKEVPLYNNNNIDWEDAIKAVTMKTKLLMIQRSTGYSFRPALTLSKIKNAIEKALKEAEEKGIKGKEATPFLLSKVKALTEGASLASNIELVYNNAKVGARLAVELAKL